MKTASELCESMPKRQFRDEINTFTLDEIFNRIQEYASDRKSNTSFYGSCRKDRQQEIESFGYKVVVYDLPPEEPMTQIRW